MAYTKVFAIRRRLDDRIDYVVNGEKTALDAGITYDALKGQPLWDGLQRIREQLQAMSENGCLLDESVRFTQHVLGYSKDWELGTLYREPFSDEPINAYRYAQVSSVSRLGEMIKNYSGIFESCCREWFMPGCDFGVQSEE